MRSFGDGKPAQVNSFDQRPNKARPISVFFYGLFMDHEVLRAAGVQPSELRVARLPEYALKIGDRATLLPAVGHTAYGVLTTLTHTELERLYAGLPVSTPTGPRPC